MTLGPVHPVWTVAMVARTQKGAAVITHPNIRIAPPVADLAAATPVEIDARRARLDQEYGRLQGRISALLGTVHSQNGERIRYVGRQKEWPTSDVDAEAQVRVKLANGDPFRSWVPRQVELTMSELDTARTHMDGNRLEMDELDFEYDRRPWRIYITVTGGHIHAGYWCAGGTVRPTTDRNWTPGLSGLDVPTAVTELGPSLCSHCFPDAPVEWTVGKPKPKGCTGKAIPGTQYRVGMTYYAKCDGCDTNQIVTSRAVLRKHKPKKEEKTA